MGIYDNEIEPFVDLRLIGLAPPTMLAADTADTADTVPTGGEEESCAELFLPASLCVEQVEQTAVQRLVDHGNMVRREMKLAPYRVPAVEEKRFRLLLDDPQWNENRLRLILSYFPHTTSPFWRSRAATLSQISTKKLDELWCETEFGSWANQNPAGTPPEDLPLRVRPKYGMAADYKTKTEAEDTADWAADGWIFTTTR